MIEVAKMSREELMLYAEELDEQRQEEFEALLKSEAELLDEDGYPTDHALLLIEKWHWKREAKEWLAFIKDLWHLRSWGWHEEDGKHEWREDEPVRRYHVSTAGWSGNESIIHAMMKNNILWDDVWVQSRRGGHYIFEVEETQGAKE